MSAALKMSTFVDEKTSTARDFSPTWSEFVEMLRSPVVAACTLAACGSGVHAKYDDEGRFKGCVHKYGAGAWSPASYGETKRRKAANVAGVALLVVDIDHVTDEELMSARDGLARYRHVVHGTHSDHPPENRSARVAIAMTRPVSASEWPRFWPAAMRALGLPHDKQCSDPNRIYFKPSIPSDATYLFAANDGAELDVDAILASAPAAKTEPPKPRSKPRKVNGEDFFEVLESLDQGRVLLEISGTALVNGETIEIGRPNRSGNRAIIVDGKSTAGFIDESGRIGHASTGSAAAGPDGGPTAFTWCRYYGHSNKQLYKLFVELVGALSNFAKRPAPSYYEDEPAANPHSASEGEPGTSAMPVAGREDERFDRDPKGKVYGSRRNIIVALKKLGVVVRYDEFAGHELIDGLPGYGPRIDESAMTRMRMLIDERFSLLPSKELFFDVVSDQAQHRRFHPVRDYLAGLHWDGEYRVERFFAEYGGAIDSAYTRAVARLFFIAAVRRARHPGVKFDEMPILESGQGTDKSTAMRKLAVRDEWFTDDLPLGTDTKRLMEMTAGKWIVEAGELKGMSQSDVASLKAYLSRQVDEARMSYGRKPTIAPRQFVIIGTTNETENYLKDSTGNRRFWPIRIERFDVARVTEDRDQLWAEAAHLEAEGESIRLDPTLYADAAEQQKKRAADEPMMIALTEILGDITGTLRTTDAYRILDLDPAAMTPIQISRLGTAMRELGWEKKQRRYDGKPEYAYVKGDEHQQLVRIAVDVSSTSPRHVTVRWEKS